MMFTLKPMYPTIGIYCIHSWLVMYLPLWKNMKVSWDDYSIPNWIDSHKIPWFQTTDQCWIDPVFNAQKGPPSSVTWVDKLKPQCSEMSTKKRMASWVVSHPFSREKNNLKLDWFSIPFWLVVYLHIMAIHPNIYIYLYTYILYWLVVYLPLRKMMEFVSWDDDIPILNGQNKSMFQNTNQF